MRSDTVAAQQRRPGRKGCLAEAHFGQKNHPPLGIRDHSDGIAQSSSDRCRSTCFRRRPIPRHSAPAGWLHYRDLRSQKERAVTGNTGNLLRAQGKLAEALAHYQKALAISNEMGHRSSAAQALQAIGLALADQGDLQGASKMFQQALATQRDIGEKVNYADTQRDMGRALMQQGDLDQARKLFDEALATQQQLGEMGSAAETRLALGELACNSGRPSEAEQFARAAWKVFRAQNEPNEQILAAVLLSRSLIEQGKLTDAAAALEVPLKLAEKKSDLTTRLSLTLAHANVLAATNNLARAEHTARRVLVEAPQDLFRLRLEASLTLAEIQCKGKNAGQGRERIQEVERAAKEKGFEMVVRRARAAGGW